MYPRGHSLHCTCHTCLQLQSALDMYRSTYTDANTRGESRGAVAVWNRTEPCTANKTARTTGLPLAVSQIGASEFSKFSGMASWLQAVRNLAAYLLAGPCLAWSRCQLARYFSKYLSVDFELCFSIRHLANQRARMPEERGLGSCPGRARPFAWVLTRHRPFARAKSKGTEEQLQVQTREHMEFH